KQGRSVNYMSFDSKHWNSDTIYITGYLKDCIANEGVIGEYFNQFVLFMRQGRFGIAFDKEQSFYSDEIKEDEGHFVFKLKKNGRFSLVYNGQTIMKFPLI